MAESEVARICECLFESRGKEGNQSQLAHGGDWIRISYERRDGWIQVQYILFDSRGDVHSIVDGTVPWPTERWHNDVDETQRVGDGDYRIVMVSATGWNVTRLVGQVDYERARRLVELTRKG